MEIGGVPGGGGASCCWRVAAYARHTSPGREAGARRQARGRMDVDRRAKASADRGRRAERTLTDRASSAMPMSWVGKLSTLLVANYREAIGINYLVCPTKST